MFDLSEQKQKLLKKDGNILVLGGPGSGKTTIALLKAIRIIEEGVGGGQHVLFLSFANATIARVEQQADTLISDSTRKHLEINTYHGFTWNLLRSHGYLFNEIAPLRLLPPPEAASRLADFDSDEERETEKRRLVNKEGLLHFDLFARISVELLSKSKALTAIVCDSYPVIILDEFQDTNSDEWDFIRVLGGQSRLMALADAEQRIYEFRGADPARIGDFIKAFNPSQFDFGTENNRSNGTDIVKFGNDLLTEANKRNKYNDVYCVGYTSRRGAAKHLDLKCLVLKTCKRLRTTGQKNWSLAVLVPTKRLMLEVSDYLSSTQKFVSGNILPAINHDVAFETAGPSLAAVLISGLLESGETDQEVAKQLINDLCEHIRGRNGNKPPSKAHLGVSNALYKYMESGEIRGKNRKLIVAECLRIAKECRGIGYTGDPAADWLAVRNHLLDTECDFIKQVAIDAKYLRLLHKGALFRSNLGVLWRNNGNYSGAAGAVRNALLDEHFAASRKVWKGIHVMTIHKAKGKEFDEVIIYEGVYQGKIVRKNAEKKEVEQSRLKLRVAVTRAMKRATILSPFNDACPFLR